MGLSKKETKWTLSWDFSSRIDITSFNEQLYIYIYILSLFKIVFILKQIQKIARTFFFCNRPVLPVVFKAHHLCKNYRLTSVVHPATPSPINHSSTCSPTPCLTLPHWQRVKLGPNVGHKDMYIIRETLYN